MMCEGPSGAAEGRSLSESTFRHGGGPVSSFQSSKEILDVSLGSYIPVFYSDTRVPLSASHRACLLEECVEIRSCFSFRTVTEMGEERGAHLLTFLLQELFQYVPPLICVGTTHFYHSLKPAGKSWIQRGQTVCAGQNYDGLPF